jgi:hypothetical protein
LIENELQRSATIKFCKKKRLKEMFISQKRFAKYKNVVKKNLKIAEHANVVILQNQSQS